MQEELTSPTNVLTKYKTLGIASKQFCWCVKCNKAALKACLGEVESGYFAYQYPSGLQVYFFKCDSCREVENSPSSVPQRCLLCDEGEGLLRRTVGGQFVHYTCALVSHKVRILSVQEMKFEIHEDELRVLENKKTRSKRNPISSFNYITLRNQALQVANREKDFDDVDLVALKFDLIEREDPVVVLQDSRELQESISSSVDFGFGQKPKKQGKKMKKSQVQQEQPNVTLLFSIDSKETFASELGSFMKSSNSPLKSLAPTIRQKFLMTPVVAEDPARPHLYCNCTEVKDGENFVACDECHVWYHCGCVGVNLDSISNTSCFFCEKCREMQFLESKNKSFSSDDFSKIKKERLTLSESIILGILSERAIQESVKPGDLPHLDLSIMDLSHLVNIRYCELLIGAYFIKRTTELLYALDPTRVYQDGVILSEEFLRLKNTVIACKPVNQFLSGLEEISGYKRMKEVLDKMDLAMQFYEEIRPRHIKIPDIIAVAKKVESHPELRTLSAYKNFIHALGIAKSKLDMVFSDFRSFAAELDTQLSANNVQGVQNAKITNSRIGEYKKELSENSLAMKIVESMLNELGIIETEKNSEIPLKLDTFLMLLKRELSSVVRAGDSEVCRVWQEKRQLFEDARMIVQKVQKLKTELPQWKDVAELSDPSAVFATKGEVERIITEAEDSILIMNSAALKKLQDLKLTTSKFEKKNGGGDHWNSFESAKRHIFTMMKTGVLFGDEAMIMARELQLHGHLIKFCNHKGSFVLHDVEETLAKCRKRFEMDWYDKAKNMVDEVKMILSKAHEAQSNPDLWSDERILEDCLRMFKKLQDYKIVLPESLSKFSEVCRAIEWLFELAEHAGVIRETDRNKNCCLKYPFESTLQKVLSIEGSILDTINIRTLGRLEKVHQQAVFKVHPDIKRLSERAMKKLLSRELEEVGILGASSSAPLNLKSPTIHIEDLKILIKRALSIDPDISKLPTPLASLLTEWKSYRQCAIQLVSKTGSENLLPLTKEELPTNQKLTSTLSSFCCIYGVSLDWHMIQQLATKLLIFSTKIDKIIHFSTANIESSSSNPHPTFSSSELSALSILISHLTSLNLYSKLVQATASQAPLQILLPNTASKQTLTNLAESFKSRVDACKQLSRHLDEIKQSHEHAVQSLADIRARKEPVTLTLLLHWNSYKHPLQAGLKLLQEFHNAAISPDDSQRAAVAKWVEDIRRIEEEGDKIFRSYLAIVIRSQDNEDGEVTWTEITKSKMEALDKDWNKLVKRAEYCIFNSDVLSQRLQSISCLSRILKAASENVNFGRWMKVREGVKESFRSNHSIANSLKPVWKSFEEQYHLLEKINKILDLDTITLEETNNLITLCKNSKIGALDNINFGELVQDLEEVLEDFHAAKKASSTQKVTIDVMKKVRKSLEDCQLEINHQETQFIYDGIEAFQGLHKMMEVAQREGLNSNGILADFAAGIYQNLPISSKVMEDYLSLRNSSLKSYDQAEQVIKAINQPDFENSYLSWEPKILRFGIGWGLRSLKLLLFIWARKLYDSRDKKLKLNMLTLEYMQSEAVDWYEKSKKLVPVEMEIICSVIVGKIDYLEELIRYSDTFLVKISTAENESEFANMQAKFSEAERVDLDSILVDMKTQLRTSKKIDHKAQTRYWISEKFRDVLKNGPTSKSEWNLRTEFSKLDDFFEKLAEQDRKVLEPRFIDLTKGVHFFPCRDIHLVLEGQVTSKEDMILGKRKLVTQKTPTNLSGNREKNLGRRYDEPQIVGSLTNLGAQEIINVDKPGISGKLLPKTDSAGNIINSHVLRNLSIIQGEPEVVDEPIRNGTRGVFLQELITNIVLNQGTKASEVKMHDISKELEARIFSASKTTSEYTQKYNAIKNALHTLQSHRGLTKVAISKDFEMAYLRSLNIKLPQQLAEMDRDALKKQAADSQIIGATMSSGSYNPLSVAEPISFDSAIASFAKSPFDTTSSLLKPGKLKKPAQIREEEPQPAEKRNMLEDVLKMTAAEMFDTKDPVTSDQDTKEKPIKPEPAAASKKMTLSNLKMLLSGPEKAKAEQKSRKSSPSAREEDEDSKGKRNRSRDRKKEKKSKKEKKNKEENPNFSADSDQEAHRPHQEIDPKSFGPFGQDWLKITYNKGRLKVFERDSAKQANTELLSCSIQLNSTDPSAVIQRFPDFEKSLALTFGKYERELNEIEPIYNSEHRKYDQWIQNPARGSRVPEVNIIGGWITYEKRYEERIAPLLDYLSKTPKTITCAINNTSSGVFFATLGKHLDQQTLGNLGIKAKYRSNQMIQADNLIVFFLKYSKNKDNQEGKRLVPQLEQSFNASLEGTFRVESKSRPANGNNEDSEKIDELVQHFKSLTPEQLKKTLISLEEDVEIIERAIQIIRNHLPECHHVLVELGLLPTTTPNPSVGMIAEQPQTMQNPPGPLVYPPSGIQGSEAPVNPSSTAVYPVQQAPGTQINMPPVGPPGPGMGIPYPFYVGPPKGPFPLYSPMMGPMPPGGLPNRPPGNPPTGMVSMQPNQPPMRFMPYPPMGPGSGMMNQPPGMPGVPTPGFRMYPPGPPGIPPNRPIMNTAGGEQPPNSGNPLPPPPAGQYQGPVPPFMVPGPYYFPPGARPPFGLPGYPPFPPGPQSHFHLHHQSGIPPQPTPIAQQGQPQVNPQQDGQNPAHAQTGTQPVPEVAPATPHPFQAPASIPQELPQ